MSLEFAMKDVRLLHFFLDVGIEHFTLGDILSQCKYIKDLLAHTGMTSCAPNTTLMVLKDKPHLSDDTLVDVRYYRSIVDAL